MSLTFAVYICKNGKKNLMKYYILEISVRVFLFYYIQMKRLNNVFPMVNCVEYSYNRTKEY